MPIFLIPALLAVLPFRLGVALHIRQSEVDLRVLQLVVLVEAALGPVGLPTHLHSALVVPLDLVRIPAHALALLGLLLAATEELLILDRLDPYLVLPQPRDKLALVLDEILHLVGEGDVGQQQPAVPVSYTHLTLPTKA